MSAFGFEEVTLKAPLWAYTMSAPGKVVDVQCRAREQGYKLHRVLEKTMEPSAASTSA